MKTALTIAGSDSSGGAGIQADIKTMLSNGVFATSVICALTAQNTMGVDGIFPVPGDFVAAQIDSVFTDIYPDAVKIGMVSDKDIILAISDRLLKYSPKNIVLDPVMVSTSGSKLISEDAIESLQNYLFPIADIITPNIPEAEVLSHIKIESPEDMIKAGEIISKKYNCAVLCKGGHRINDASDLLYDNGSYKWYYGEHINNFNTHGTGCTLSSAIASNLAKGYDMDESVNRAKKYISGALSAMLDLGQGSGPLDHGFDNKGFFTK